MSSSVMIETPGCCFSPCSAVTSIVSSSASFSVSSSAKAGEVRMPAKNSAIGRFLHKITFTSIIPRRVSINENAYNNENYLHCTQNDTRSSVFTHYLMDLLFCVNKHEVVNDKIYIFFKKLIVMRPSSFCFQYRFGKRLTYVGSSEITLEVERSKAGVKRAISLLSAIVAEGKELTIIT